MFHPPHNISYTCDSSTKALHLRNQETIVPRAQILNIKSYYLLLAVFGGICAEAEPVVFVFFLLTGVMQLFTTDSAKLCYFLTPRREIQCAFLVNEEINIVWQLCISGEEDTAIGNKRHNSCRDASFKMASKH